MIKTIRITGKQQAWLETFQEHQNLLVNCCTQQTSGFSISLDPEQVETAELTFRFSARPKTVSYEDTQLELINTEIEHFKKVLTPSMHGKLKALFNDDFMYTPRTRRTAAETNVSLNERTEGSAAAITPAVIATPPESPEVETPEIFSEEEILSCSFEEERTSSLLSLSIITPEELEVLSEITDMIKSEIPQHVLELATQIVNRIEEAAVAYANLFNKEPSDYPIDAVNKSYYKVCREIVDICNAAEIEETKAEQVIDPELEAQFNHTSSHRGNKHRDEIQHVTIAEFKDLAIVQSQYMNSGMKEWPEPNANGYILVDKNGKPYQLQTVEGAMKEQEQIVLSNIASNKPVENRPVDKPVVAPAGLNNSAIQREIEMKQRQAERSNSYASDVNNPWNKPQEVPDIKDLVNHNYSDDDILASRSYDKKMQEFVDLKKGGKDYVMPEHTKLTWAIKKEIAKCLTSTERAALQQQQQQK